MTLSITSCARQEARILKLQSMTPDLIPLTKFPTIPAPLHSYDAGESWVWGDFVLVLQKNSITLAEVFNAMSPKKTFHPWCRDAALRRP